MKEMFKWILKNKKNIILLIFSLIFTFIFLEFINYLFLTNDRVYYVWPPNLNETFLPDSSVINGISGMSVFTINELGYRGPIIENKKNEYRILAVGGSVTESLYLDNDETWPNLIMEKINITKDGRKVIVMNIGKSGHNTRDHILQLQRLINVYEPNFIILMVGANDMLLKLSKRWVWKPFDESSYDYTKSFSYVSDYSIKSTLIYKIYKILNGRFNLGFNVQDSVGKNIAESRLERKESESIINVTPDLAIVLDDYERNLIQLIKISRGNNVSILLVTQPYLWKENMSEEEDSSLWMTTDFNGNFYTTDVMIESMEGFNLRLLDVCKKNKEALCFDLEGKMPKSLEYFYDDMHFNEKGAEFVAEQFVEYIRNNLDEF